MNQLASRLLAFLILHLAAPSLTLFPCPRHVGWAAVSGRSISGSLVCRHLTDSAVVHINVLQETRLPLPSPVPNHGPQPLSPRTPDRKGSELEGKSNCKKAIFNWWLLNISLWQILHLTVRGPSLRSRMLKRHLPSSVYRGPFSLWKEFMTQALPVSRLAVL